MNDKNDEITKTKSEGKKTKNKKSSVAGIISTICLVSGLISLFCGFTTLDSLPKSAGPYGINITGSAIAGLFLIGSGGISLLIAIISFIVHLSKK